jgi:hypothetical protein
MGPLVLPQIVYIKEMYIIFYCFLKSHVILKIIKLQLTFWGSMHCSKTYLSFMNICAVLL